MATETKTFYPGAYKADSNDYYRMKNATNPVGKGSANTTYASFENRPYQSGIVYWPFDTSIIPAEATIDSVACMAKGSCNSSTKGSMQLYSGTVAKGSATSTKTSAAVYNLSCGTWTRAELDNIRLLTKITNANSNSSIFYFYGADLTVAYTYQSEKFMLKLSGAYNDVARTFKKVSGIWVEQTELSGVVEDGVRYQNGGEYISPYKTISVTGSGYVTMSGQNYPIAYITIDGQKISSAGTYQVESGTTVDFLASPFYNTTLQSDITLNGQSVGTTGADNDVSYQHTVNENEKMTVKLSVTGTDYTSWVGHIEITTATE